MMDLSLHPKFQPTLAPNEELLWTGQPKQGLRFRVQHIFIIPFAFVWTGFYAIWGGALLFNEVPLLIGIPFGIVGLCMYLFGMYISIGEIFVNAYQRSKTYYALTNKRVIVRNEGIGGKTTFYELRSITNLSAETGKDGRGTVIFGPVSLAHGRTINLPGISHQMLPVFDMIPDTDQVYRMIQDLRDG